MVDILNSLDILAVQEHWLSKQGLSSLISIHSDFNARGISSIDYGYGLSGRPHGGLCFLWRRSLDPFIEPLIYVDEKRLLGLKIMDLHNYHTQTGLLLSAIDVPHEVLRCTNPNCNDEAHRTLLSKLYNDIIKSLKTLPR